MIIPPFIGFEQSIHSVRDEHCFNSQSVGAPVLRTVRAMRRTGSGPWNNDWERVLGF
jgi:hypothetical protein